MKRYAVIFLLFVLSAHAREYSPPLNQPEMNNLYWGDLHLHSNYSPDAFAFGNSRLSPNEALTFARGKRVTASNGLAVQLRRPLDFLLVADHSEFLGVFPKLVGGDKDFLATALGTRWRKKMSDPKGMSAIILEWVELLNDQSYEQELSVPYRTQVWEEVAAIAEEHNQPGQFTAFVGYEWSSIVDGNNLHRVVVFKDGADVATQLPPYSAMDSRDPEDLWAALAKYEETTGGKVMAIPHNGNLSNGYMFATETLSGKPIDVDYARRRSRWEPVYEVTQVKGDGEAHPLLSPDDEFADFETWDEGNISMSAVKEASMLPHEYARSALRLGLELEQSVGVNPFEFGMIGSTDAHNSLSTADDNNFWGKFLDSEPSAERMDNPMGGLLWTNWKLAASGYAGVWARENTREALFEALQRKEVYATTGPRIALRFFGGWDFEAADIHSPDFVALGYDKGVPMGGSLVGRAGRGAPRFMLHALKDPDGANLDRIQIVKGWLKADGTTQERVYDVALSNNRRVDPETGKAESLRSTVDVAAATYSNSIGAVSLSTVWEDPDFDAQQEAFYYARVIEIPTPRWTAYDASYYRLEVSDEVPMVTQERVYSSPIWYQGQ